MQPYELVPQTIFGILVYIGTRRKNPYTEIFCDSMNLLFKKTGYHQLKTDKLVQFAFRFAKINMKIHAINKIIIIIITILILNSHNNTNTYRQHWQRIYAH